MDRPLPVWHRDNVGIVESSVACALDESGADRHFVLAGEAQQLLTARAIGDGLGERLECLESEFADVPVSGNAHLRERDDLDGGLGGFPHEVSHAVEVVTLVSRLVLKLNGRDADIAHTRPYPSRRCVVLRDGLADFASFQNCFSPITVTAWPLSASRRTSSSFTPASAPAICNAFGRPRTNTSDDGPGFDCTIAPAFFAAAIASFRGRVRKPVNESRLPLRLLIRPRVGCAGRCRSAAMRSRCIVCPRCSALSAPSTAAISRRTKRSDCAPLRASQTLRSPWTAYSSAML